jgi:hypothetical protein
VRRAGGVRIRERAASVTFLVSLTPPASARGRVRAPAAGYTRSFCRVRAVPRYSRDPWGRVIPYPLKRLSTRLVQPIGKTSDADQTGAGQTSRKHGLIAQAEPAGQNPIQGESRGDAAEEAQGLQSNFFDHSLLPGNVARFNPSNSTFYSTTQVVAPILLVFLYPFIRIYNRQSIGCKSASPPGAKIIKARRPLRASSGNRIMRVGAFFLQDGPDCAFGFGAVQPRRTGARVNRASSRWLSPVGRLKPNPGRQNRTATRVSFLTMP